jgi:hypothetical protein
MQSLLEDAWSKVESTKADLQKIGDFIEECHGLLAYDRKDRELEEVYVFLMPRRRRRRETWRSLTISSKIAKL